MDNRKRRSARPVLEAMECRVVPSAMGLASHQVRVVVAHVETMNHATKTPKETQRSVNQGLKRLQQQLALVQEHAHERAPSARETPAEKAASQTSSLFKSIFASL
jgi:hypothetical protein